MKKNLILTGMMGVGKSTVGKSLSERLNMQFIDVDNLIESEENMSIRNIFEKKGEKYFRNVEKTLSLRSIKTQNVVISLGGGSFVDTSVREAINQTSLSFWLDLGIPNLAKRLANSKKRPLINGKNLEETLGHIYKKRENIYKLANFKIDCNKKDKSIILDEIINFYEAKCN